MGSLTSGIGGVVSGYTPLNAITGGGLGSLIGQAGNGIDTALGGKLGAGLILNAANADQANEQYANAQKGLAQQEAFLHALQAQNGIQNQSDVYNQYQAMVNGQGPNPAQNMLNQATSANTANQAALIASQRGAGQNVGLIGRQAAQQGNAAQQNAIAQAATMRAQQQQAAMGQLAGLSTQQVNQQGNATTGYSQAAQGEQGQVLNAIAQQNNAIAGINKGKQQAAANVLSGLTGAVGSAAGLSKTAAVAAAHGGVIESQETDEEPMSFLRKHSLSADQSPMQPLQHQFVASIPAPAINAAHGGKVPAMVSPGEAYLRPQQAQDVAKGKKHPLKSAEIIPGKAKMKGDHLENDTVPKTLEEGGVVIPKSVMESSNPAKNAAAFVKAHLAKHGRAFGSKRK